MPARYPAPASTRAPSEKRPRHYAAELVDAWVAGKPTDDVLAAATEHLRDHVSSMARAWCMLIKHHAAHDTDPRGAKMIAWVREYRARRLQGAR